MAEFDFRLRFHLHDSGRIDCDGEELLVIEESDGKRLRLRSAGKHGDSIKNHPQVAVFGGPYLSEDEAREAAERARNALLICAVRNRIGIDLGGHRPLGRIFKYGLDMLESELVRPVRNDIHGIDVYEHQDDLAFTSTQVQVIGGKNASVFIKHLATSFQNPVTVDEKQILAAELYCSSFFDISYRSRLLTLVTAVEALLDPAILSPKVENLVSKMETMVAEEDLDESTKNAMFNSLQWMKQYSIGQTSRALITQLLGNMDYDVLLASRFFAHCYELRSQILHSGKLSDDSIDLSKETNTLQVFVADLLLASFGINE